MKDTSVMPQNKKVDLLICLLSPHVLNPGTHPEGQVPAGVLPKASSDRSFGTSYFANGAAAAMPSPMSLFGNSPCRVLLQRNATESICSSLEQMDSTMIGHSASFRDTRHSTLDPRPSTLDSRPSISYPRPSTLDKNLHSFISGRYTFPFSFILLLSVCCWQTSPGSCYFHFYFAVCLSQIFPQLKQIILV